MRFKTETMFEIMTRLASKLQEQETVSFEVLNPDRCDSCYAGETVNVDHETYLYHGYKAWIDLAQILNCKMLTPEVVSETTVRLHYKKLDTQASFHTEAIEVAEEKYGARSHFFSIHKNEEPVFLDAYMRALHHVSIQGRMKVLNLGVNRGDEFELIQKMVDAKTFDAMRLVGVDHSLSAIEQAQKIFPTKYFYTHDINKLDELKLGTFDLIISIGTLQSPGVEFKRLFHDLVQHYLEPSGALILGFPNSRWKGGEMVYGAKMRNYSESDLSLLVKDIHYCKKYLQQKKYQVRLSGRDYIFLTAKKAAVTEKSSL